VREELVKLLALSRKGEKAADPKASAWSSGYAAGLKDAIKLIDKAL
jgi:hypothetical protein